MSQQPLPHPLPVPAEALARLDALRERIREELAITSYKGRDWVPRTEGVLDVLIVGGGHAGQTVAFGLARKDITNVLVVDGAPAGLEGPWSTTARMRTLRTPKTLKGPDLDLPSLSPQAWFIARYGRERWDAITYIPRLDWQEYLLFYREAVGVEVKNLTRVTEIAPPTGDDPQAPFAVTLAGPAGPRTVQARRIVFATGIEGAGGPQIPAALFDHLPAGAWAHTSHAIDFDALAGKRVGVLGGGASAFDAAGTALEHGAARVDAFMRRDRMPEVNPLRWMEFASFIEHYADWDDAQKWAFSRRELEVDQPTTQHSLWRCFAHDGFDLHLGALWLATRIDGEEIVVDVGGEEWRFDFVIAGTGVAVDLRMRPELAGFADRIARWGDRYEPAAGTEHAGLARYPYLRSDFAFTEREPGTAPWLSRLYHFAQGARVTMGLAGHMLSGLPAGTDRLVWGITRDLFREHAASILDDFRAYAEPELRNVGPRPEGLPAEQRFASSAQAETAAAERGEALVV